MRESWLIQRLCKPFKITHPDSLLAKMGDNPFSFGGGLKNGGLSDDAMGFIRDIWRFDYMGAAEFEFGAVPKALQAIAKSADAGELVAAALLLDIDQIAPSWRDDKRHMKKGEKPRERAAGGVVYILARRGEMDEVKQRVAKWAGADYNGDLKETTHLARTLDPVSEYDGDSVGWLELDNGFMFFTDLEMFNQTCNLFGVEQTVVSKA